MGLNSHFHSKSGAATGTQSGTQNDRSIEGRLEKLMSKESKGVTSFVNHLNSQVAESMECLFEHDPENILAQLEDYASYEKQNGSS
mmetsp:Transcript_19006/g.29151  ORF Transcript_19006/g.29151 Transcript_19006/m.29151 type:complete len:86 (+) Transcript_19006:166-423(+)